MGEILEILQGALIAVLIAGIGLLQSTVTKYLKEKSEMIKSSNQRQLAQDSLHKANVIVGTVVSSIQQSLVNNLKAASADGKLTKQEVLDIQRLTARDIDKLVDDDLRYDLDNLVGNAELFLKNLIEAKVLELRKDYIFIDEVKQIKPPDITETDEAAIV